MIDQMDEWIIFVLFTQLNLVYPPSCHNFVLIEFQLAEAAQELSQLSFVSASFWNNNVKASFMQLHADRVTYASKVQVSTNIVYLSFIVALVYYDMIVVAAAF